MWRVSISVEGVEGRTSEYGGCGRSLYGGCGHVEGVDPGITKNTCLPLPPLLTACPPHSLSSSQLAPLTACPGHSRPPCSQLVLTMGALALVLYTLTQVFGVRLPLPLGGSDDDGGWRGGGRAFYPPPGQPQGEWCRQKAARAPSGREAVVAVRWRPGV